MYIHKIQLGIDEDLNENNDLSNELRDIMERARHLLCDIEFYVNATKQEGVKSDRLKILTIQEMSDILRFPKRSTETQADQIRVHSKFVKKRFESYITILLKRLQRPGSLKVETKSGGKKRKCANKLGTKDQNALRKPNCGRRKLRKNVELIANEPKTTPKMQHLNRKKNNFINQKFEQQNVANVANGGSGEQNKQIVQIKIRGVKSNNDINNQNPSFNPQNKRRKLKLERLRNHQERNIARHRKNGINIPVTTTTQSPLLN